MRMGEYRASASSPIGVFDSGLGGLTVVQALRRILPHEEIVYFGDTARVPYGNKSTETILRFTREICHFLLHLEPKCIIAACNTVSALAIQEVASEIPVPLCGVVEPSAESVVHESGVDLAAVIGTEATIASGAFERAIRRLNPQIRVIQQSCPLFVPMIEEGRTSHDPLVKVVIDDYLSSMSRLKPDAVVLGCTHYPLLKPSLQEYLGPHVKLIDSGEAVSRAVANLLGEQDLLSESHVKGKVHCYVSDFPQRFSAIASRFLGEPLPHAIRANVESWQLAQQPSTRARA